jgi:hypothetical protein
MLQQTAGPLMVYSLLLGITNIEVKLINTILLKYFISYDMELVLFIVININFKFLSSSVDRNIKMCSETSQVKKHSKEKGLDESVFIMCIKQLGKVTMRQLLPSATYKILKEYKSTGQSK